MLKEATYKEKFVTLAHWLPAIIDSIKKDLKNEHLKKDIAFVRQYFVGKNPAKLTTEELVEAYREHMARGENTEELGEFITNRWLLKHADLYDYFEKALSRISPNFQELDVIDSKVAHEIMQSAVQEFGAPNTYLFCVLNSVVFPEEVYTKLQHKAKETAQKDQSEAKVQQEQASVESLKRNYEQQLARLTDKYEKKISGLQKKYTTDVETLKKQVANLQRKLNV